MKTPALLLLGAACAFALTAEVRSQADLVPQTHLQQLQSMKAANAKLIEKQTTTLQKLDALQLESQQVRFLGKRS